MVNSKEFNKTLFLLFVFWGFSTLLRIKCLVQDVFLQLCHALHINNTLFDEMILLTPTNGEVLNI